MGKLQNSVACEYFIHNREKLHHIAGLLYVRQNLNCAVKANIPAVFNYAFT